ncbi:MAG: phthalate 4,5-dioxygenase oxygenase subunit [Chloroflexi bacterium]|nr:phthalate 4,5-dioxygenase oxygenase subunit [Chloroflexota bacterium]
MQTLDEYDLITRVGPDTLMGNVLRRYWLPALVIEDLSAADCPPVRVRLLGEDLVAFRDSNDRFGLLEEFCPHRCASLFLGRNEQSGLRCVYHGWKFDVEGRCIDMPTEPAHSTFKDRVRANAYPLAERAGILWAYLGPPEKQPPLPDMEWMRAPASHRFVSKTIERANYLQALEGGIDTAHSSFLHNNNLGDRTSFRQMDGAPTLELERTDYGFQYASLRDIGEDGIYLRVYQFFMPFTQYRSHQLEGRRGAGRAEIPMLKGHLWVPIDDENTCVYNFMMSVDEDKPFDAEYVEREETAGGRGSTGETTVRHRVRENDWLIDREMQRTRNFTGIVGVNTQDLAVQESMGRIVDRSREHLGSTDRAVMTCRAIMREAIKDVAEGIDPPGLDPSTYRHQRAADVVIPKGVRWQDAAGRELVARH